MKTLSALAAMTLIGASCIAWAGVDWLSRRYQRDEHFPSNDE